SWKAWQERLPLIFDSRPVLHEKTSEEMNELFYKRKKIYEEYHHIKVNVHQLSIDTTAKQIINSLKEDAYRLNSQSTLQPLLEKRGGSANHSRHYEQVRDDVRDP